MTAFLLKDIAMTIQPTIERPHRVGSGTQKIYRFDNGFGASVVQFTVGGIGGSYGADSGLWELAVIRFTGENTDADFTLTYDTPITDDVLGRLTDEDVQVTLGLIRALAAPAEGEGAR
jgi:hypothetical protein